MGTTDDLGDSLKITKTEGRPLNAGGGWPAADRCGCRARVYRQENSGDPDIGRPEFRPP